MLKKIIIGILAVLVITAAAVSAYNVWASPAQAAQERTSNINVQPAVQPGQGNGNGGGYGKHGRNANSNNNVNATPNPQNGMTELLTFSGTVSNYAAPVFTLTTSDGKTINAQLGNLNYLSSLGLSLTNGEAVTVTGFWDASGSFAVQQITLNSSGQTFSLRDDLGRPLWRGGANH